MFCQNTQLGDETVSLVTKSFSDSRLYKFRNTVCGCHTIIQEPHHLNQCPPIPYPGATLTNQMPLGIAKAEYKGDSTYPPTFLALAFRCYNLGSWR